MVIAGIDYSLTSPAICVFDDIDGTMPFRFENCTVYFLTAIQKHQKMYNGNIIGEGMFSHNTDCQRYHSISDWAIEVCSGIDEVALEGYAFGAKGKVFNIAENTGILKYRLFELGIPIEVIPPSVIKKFATGKGNSNKDAMHESFLDETEIDLITTMTPSRKKVANPVSDVVDAYYICKYLYYQNKEED
jgi:Holliday junction resolvasome RuvABC endonuclease subunit